MDTDLAELIADQSKISHSNTANPTAPPGRNRSGRKTFIQHSLKASERLAMNLGDKFLCPQALPLTKRSVARVLDRMTIVIQDRILLEDSENHPRRPSGLITRGRDDVLPTGPNFYY